MGFEPDDRDRWERLLPNWLLLVAGTVVWTVILFAITAAAMSGKTP